MSCAIQIISLAWDQFCVAERVEQRHIRSGVAGALLGSRVCSGNGKIAATAAGGIIGSMVGGNVTNGMNSVNGSSNDRTLQPTYFGSPQPAYASPVSSAAVDQYGRYVQYASQQL